jgi:hypothetical protein
VKEKIIYNADKSRYINDPKLFKKLSENIWEFRTEYSGVQYRLLAFWDKRDKKETLVIATHGITKKRDKVPQKEINKAESIRRYYFRVPKEDFGNKDKYNKQSG